MVDHFADALDADEGGVSLVAVIDVVPDAQLAQGADAADAQQDLLLEAVLPVAAVEVVGDLAVLLEVGLEVGVEQVEVRAAHLAFPDARRERAAREGDGDRHPAAGVVAHGRNGQLVEVLRFVGGLLRPLGREPLREVAVAVEQAHGGHRHVLVRSLLEVVAGQDAQTARIDLQRRMESVLHREVGDRRGLRVGLFVHVVAELRVHGVELREEVRVVLELFEPFDAQLVEEGDRVAVRSGPQGGVDAFEQVAGAGIPAPPEVARQLLEGVQPFGQRLIDHHAVPVGLFDEKLLTHEVDLFGLRPPVVEHGAVGPHDGAFDRLGIGLLVGRVEVLPERRGREIGGRDAHFVHVLVVERGEAHQRVGDLLLHLPVVVVVAADHLHAGVLAVLFGPDAEAGQRRGDRRHGEGDRLERRVPPRLVVGGEDRQVHAREQFVVVLVEDAVGPVEVGRHEDHLHLRFGRRENAVLQGVHDRVPCRILQQVSRVGVLCRVDGLRGIGQMGLEVGARAAVAGRHGDIGEHLAPELVRRRELLERLDEHVDALVAEFVAAAGPDDQRLGGEPASQARLGHGDQGLAGLVALGVVLLAGPYEVVLETVGRDTVRFAAQEKLAFVGRDVAHGEEGVVVRRGGLLDRVLGRDVELAGQFVGVEFREVAVERQAVPGDAAAHDRGVRGEHRGHVGGVFAQVEASGGRHPFVEVGDDLFGRGAEGLDVGGDHRARGVAEEHRLDVVPLPGERIDVVALPELGEDFVLARDERGEVHQYGQRLALDLPAADADAQALRIDRLTPGFEQGLVLLEFGIRPFVREVGADQDVAVPEFPGHGLGLGRDDGVDAAYFVAYLPACLEQEVGSESCVAHILFFTCMC